MAKFAILYSFKIGGGIGSRINLVKTEIQDSYLHKTCLFTNEANDTLKPISYWDLFHFPWKRTVGITNGENCIKDRKRGGGKLINEFKIVHFTRRIWDTFHSKVPIA